MNHQNCWMAGRPWRRFYTALSLVLVTLSSQAQNAIEAVSGSIQGGAEVVRIDLSQALAAVPAGFSIQSPARIALDFPGVSNAMGRSTVEINQGNLKSVSVVQAGERTRVVLNLKQPTAYKAQWQGKSLLVVLDPISAVAPVAATTPTFAETRNRDTLPIKDLDFRRGVSGSGRVVVSLPNNQVGVDIRQQGQTLVVEFMKSSLPEGLKRRLDVADFGTPVQTVTTFQTGDRVRMVIEPRGAWEHSAYQSDEQFVVEVRPQKIDPSKLTQGPGYSGQKLSLNFQNIEVRSLLQVIADFTNFNIVTSDSVAGAVTLRLQDVPWDQALDIILQAKGLGQRKSGNVIWIAPKDEILAKEKLERESNVALEGLEPVRTQSFQINYAKANEIAVQLNAKSAGGGADSRILSPRGSVLAEPRTNQLFVTDIPSKLEQVQQLILKLDVAVRQVLIEARIVEASDSFGKALGVKLGGGINPAGGVEIANVNGNAFQATIGSSYTAGSATTTSGNFVNLPITSVLGGAGPAATFAVSIFNAAADRFLNLELSALEADGKGKIVSSPRVVTSDQKKASIEAGQQLPYTTCDKNGACSTSFISASLKLEVTPQITPEGNVILDLNVSKNSPGLLTPSGYSIDTKNIITQVLVENGGTVVIGGIFTLKEDKNDTKVPVLGDIPIFGNLFKSNSLGVSKTEMLIFVTPKMISDKVAR